jgi:hypothetical protein
MKKTIKLYYLFALLLCISCSNSMDNENQDDPLSEYSNSVILDWNLIALDAMGGPTYPLPLLNSRINAMMHIAMHDAINSVSPHYERYAYSGNHPDANPVIAAAVAAHTVLGPHFEDQQSMLDEELNLALSIIPDGVSKTSGIEAGLAAGKAILNLRDDDGAFADLIDNAEPSDEPGVYQHVPPFDFAYGKNWTSMQPFALNSNKQFRSVPYPPLTSQKYLEDYNEVKMIGQENSTHITEDEAFIAGFWYELSEMGWNKIARKVAVQEELNLAETARLFALLDIALADSYIAGFESKYYYNFWRPYTAIMAAYEDGNDQTEPLAGWVSSQPTPPVPDYPSTHSALGNAGATVLAYIVGDDTEFTFQSTTGIPAEQTRTFQSFTQAADENANSRVLAGIHFRTACDVGQKLGDDVGAWVISNNLRPLD